jgi:hypothetical protein
MTKFSPLAVAAIALLAVDYAHAFSGPKAKVASVSALQMVRSMFNDQPSTFNIQLLSLLVEAATNFLDEEIRRCQISNHRRFCQQHLIKLSNHC